MDDSKIKRAMDKIVAELKPIPQFPESFGPLDMSNRTYTGKMKDVDLEVSRVIIRNKMRAMK